MLYYYQVVLFRTTAIYLDNIFVKWRFGIYDAKENVDMHEYLVVEYIAWDISIDHINVTIVPATCPGCWYNNLIS